MNAVAPTSSPLVFDPIAHRYTLAGVEVPSVTQVLKQSGYISFAGIPDAVLERARERGQRVHQALQFMVEDDLDDASIDDDISGYLESGQQYLRRHVRTVLRAEMRVWSLAHGCAGTLDLLAIHDDGVLSVDDFKTGDPADVAADLQTAAYYGFLLEMRRIDEELMAEIQATAVPLTITRRRSIRLFRDGREAVETVYPDPRDYPLFLNALSVVHHQRKRPAPLVVWDDER